jgi:hypothetical protein
MNSFRRFEPMAKPDTDDGWIKLAHELFAALMLADLTKAERMILHEVLNQMYRGPVKHRTATIKPAELCQRLGCLREYAWKGLKGLVDAGILIKQKPDTFTFVKDYESWTRKGGKVAMLSPREAERCQSMTNTINTSTPMRNQPVTEPVGYGTNGLRSPEPVGYANRNPLVTVPLIGTRAIKKEEEEKKRRVAHARDFVPEDSADEAEPDASLEQAHADRAKFVQAVRDSFSSLLEVDRAQAMKLERWLVSYSHEYDDVPRAIRAVREVRGDMAAGIKVFSIGGAIRTKYEAMGAGTFKSRNGGVGNQATFTSAELEEAKKKYGF